MRHRRQFSDYPLERRFGGRRGDQPAIASSSGKPLPRLLVSPLCLAEAAGAQYPRGARFNTILLCAFVGGSAVKSRASEQGEVPLFSAGLIEKFPCERMGSGESAE